MSVALQTDESLLLRRDAAGIAWLTMNRPAARNALSVVVMGGAGPAFCAGHDLREIRQNPGREVYAALFEQCSRLMTKIVRLDKPVIARVHGVATAAGCQLVASCDLAIASDTSRLA